MFLALSVTAATVLQGCTAGRLKATDLYDRQILQEGVLAAPTGPHMLGPQLEPGQASVSGALEYSQPMRATATRSRGASGAALALAWGRAQVGVGVTDYFQLGFEAEGSPAGLAAPVATDVTTDRWPGVAVRGGLDTRFHFDAGHVAFELLTEVALSNVRYSHEDRVVETLTVYADDGSSWADADESVAEDVHRRLFVSGRMGGGLVVPVGPVRLRAGTMVQTAPWLYGSWRDHWGCKYYEYGEECINPSDPPVDVAVIVVPGLFLDGSVKLGPGTVLNASTWLDVDPGRWDRGLMARPGGALSLSFLVAPPPSSEPPVEVGG